MSCQRELIWTLFTKDISTSRERGFSFKMRFSHGIFSVVFGSSKIKVDKVSIEKTMNKRENVSVRFECCLKFWRASVSIVCVYTKTQHLIDSQFLKHLNRCLLHCNVILAAIHIAFFFHSASPNVDKWKRETGSEKRERNKNMKSVSNAVQSFKVYAYQFLVRFNHMDFILYDLQLNLYNFRLNENLDGARGLQQAACDWRVKCITCQCVNCIYLFANAK